MRVCELIAELSKCDQDAYVAVYDYDDNFDGLIGISGAFVRDNTPTDPTCPEQWVFTLAETVDATTQQIIIIG
jgi:hypothetical protein